jgi:hypothetical protein
VRDSDANDGAHDVRRADADRDRLDDPGARPIDLTANAGLHHTIPHRE